MTNITLIPYGHFEKAWLNWSINVPYQAWGQFQDYVGSAPFQMKDVAVNREHYIEVTQEQARRIDMLAGPHNYAVIKAYLAQQHDT